MVENVTSANTETRHSVRYRPALIAGVAGLGVFLSLAGFFLMSDRDRRQAESALEVRATGHAKAIQYEIDLYLQALDSMRTALATTVRLDSGLFGKFIRNGVARLDGIEAVTWNPLVRTAAGRGQKFPVLFAEPGVTESGERQGRIAAILGTDFYATPELRAAMETARDSGGQIASLADSHFEHGVGQQGILVFHPVYRGGDEPVTIPGRRSRLRGFIVVGLNVGDMIESVIRKATVASGLHFYVYDSFQDTEAISSDRLLHLHGSRTRDGVFEPVAPDNLSEEAHWIRVISVAGQRWTVVFRAATGNQLAGFSKAALIILLGGLALTGVIFVFLMISSRRTREIESLLSEVSSGNARLQSEVDTRGAAESKFRRLVQSAPDPTIISNADGEIVHVSNQAVVLFGYAEEELIGRKIELLMPDRYRGAHPPQRDQFFRTGDVRPMGTGLELVGLDRNGREFPIEISLSRIETGGENLVTATARDITDRKAHEDELRLAWKQAEDQARDLEELNFSLQLSRDQAEGADRAKSEFLTMMSHELRTPLNAVIGLSGIICSESFGPIGNEKYADYIEKIRDSGQHLLEIIQDILSLTQLENGEFGLNEEDVDVPKLVRDTIEFLTRRSVDDGISLTFECPDNLPRLRADPSKLGQIVASLISNALKFTGKGGTVVVQVWNDTESGFVIQVSDTGIGIALEDIPKALAPFGQVQSDMNREFEGTGRGLPLAKALVELHSGSFDLQSKPGIGTTVTMRFPAERVVVPDQESQALAS